MVSNAVIWHGACRHPGAGIPGQRLRRLLRPVALAAEAISIRRLKDVREVQLLPVAWIAELPG
jgi:hypothetical protein